MALKILALDGLSDAKLCKLVSRLLESIQGVDYANIDYLSQRLTLQLSGRDNSKTIAKVVLTLKENMPNVIVRFADAADDNRKNEPVIYGKTPEKSTPPEKSSQSSQSSQSNSSNIGNVGAPSNVAKTISSMIKDDTAELNRKKEMEKERKAEEVLSSRKQSDPLSDLLPQSSQLIDSATQGVEGVEDKQPIPEEQEGEHLPDDLPDNYTWEVVDGESTVDPKADNGELEEQETDFVEKVDFFETVRTYMSMEIFWQLVGIAGGLIALLIGVCFPEDSPANYVFTTASFVALAIFALLVDSSDSRVFQITSSIITVLGCAALFFTGGSRPIACIGLAFYHASILGGYFLQRSNKTKLEAVVNIKPKTLVRVQEDIRETIDFTALLPTDEIVIEEGQCIPFDGIVVFGEGMVDEAFIKGTKSFRKVAEGDQVECGTYNMSGTIRIVMISLQEGTAAGIIRKSLLEDNPSHNKITGQVKRFQVMAVLIQLFLSAAVLFLFLLGEEYEKCLAFLPIVFILLAPTNISEAVERIQTSLLAKAISSGIVITSSARFDEIAEIKTLAMGCSGVLTDGVPVVDSVIPEPEQFVEDIARAAAYTEYEVDHPIARVLVDYYTTTYKKPIVPSSISVCEPMVGGVRALTDYGMLLVGSERFMDAGRISYPKNEMGQLCIYVVRYGECMGRLILREQFNEGFAGIGSALRGAGVEKVVLVTGRDKNGANIIGKRGSFDKVSPEHTEESKRDQLLLLSKERGAVSQVAYAGLVEDASLVVDFCPCIAMGEGAMESMLHCAKAVIPTASPQKLLMLFKLAKLSHVSGQILSIVTFSLSTVALLLAAFGVSSFLATSVFLLLLNLAQHYFSASSLPSR